VLNALSLSTSVRLEVVDIKSRLSVIKRVLVGRCALFFVFFCVCSVLLSHNFETMRATTHVFDTGIRMSYIPHCGLWYPERYASLMMLLALSLFGRALITWLLRLTWKKEAAQLDMDLDLFCH